MDDRQLALLRPQLDHLKYEESFDASSGDLVQKLLKDLVHATESYRAVKQQAGKQAQDLAVYDANVGHITRLHNIYVCCSFREFGLSDSQVYAFANKETCHDQLPAGVHRCPELGTPNFGDELSF